jgi:hypothetical protein
MYGDEIIAGLLIFWMIFRMIFPMIDDLVIRMYRCLAIATLHDHITRHTWKDPLGFLLHLFARLKRCPENSIGLANNLRLTCSTTFFSLQHLLNLATAIQLIRFPPLLHRNSVTALVAVVDDDQRSIRRRP